MRNMERCDHEERINECMTYEPEGECMGTSGRKLRQVCVWCPNFRRYHEKKEKEGENNEKSG